MNWLKSLTIICIGAIVISSCAQQEESKSEFDTQSLPEGVERATYEVNLPNANNFTESRIDPPFWWTEMANDTLELLIYDREIRQYGARIMKPGIEVLEVMSLENPNYLFVRILIGEKATPGRFMIQLTEGGQPVKTYSYELKPRIFIPGRVDPVDQSDILYLLMPDRFANGDTTNDSFDDMLQTGIDRSKMYFRHGGDIQGISENITHLKSLGITALWSTPLLENDQPYSSYHGYAVTDHYSIDKRFGSNNEYVRLSSSLQANDIKLVKDLVFNHVGHKHWFIQDIPSPFWIHQGPTYQGSNHTSSTIIDPYASSFDKNRMLFGWFDYSMPDLNQGHPRLATYLIQNAIWWIEFAGVDAFRLDTYQYCDQEFMKEMGRQVLNEYPGFYFFGETWVYSDPLQASFVKGSKTSSPGTVMPGVADFQLNFAIKDALEDEPEVHKGIYQIYYTLANDFLYEDPANNIIFLDNHDMDRISATAGDDPVLIKSALTMLMTMRGIPCIYYGTEFGFRHKADPDGKVRPDMPGGWQDDPKSLFKAEDRDSLQNAMFTHVQKLIRLRKESPALTEGVTTQFAPEGNEGVYIYFRTLEDNVYFILFNSTSEEKVVPRDRFFEMLGKNAVGEEAITNSVVSFHEGIKVPAHTTLMLRPVKR